MAARPIRSKTLRAMTDPSGLRASRAGRMLDMIRRDMDLKRVLMDRRRRNEEVLSLSYQDDQRIGGGDEWENLRENALNLPYRYARWLESQATSKKMVVKVNRDAGPGQVAGGPGDDETGMWQGIALQRIAYEAGFKREIKAVINEVLPRGTSVMRIGFHKQEVGLADVRDAAKDVQSVVAEAMLGDVEAKEGQDHKAIRDGLAAIAEDDIFQAATTSDQYSAILARKESHDRMLAKEEMDDDPISSARDTRRRIWMRKLRVGEDVGWAPYVYDVEDSHLWWERELWTVAEVKESDLFKPAFKAVVEGYDARNVSGVAEGGETPSTDSMGSDARQAQGEDILDDDEKVVEIFVLWIRRPDMASGGIRKMVCAEYPDDFVERDESNPLVDEKGRCLIPGFYPFYDFTPILSPLTVPERTCGVPPLGVGMPQFEKIAEYNRLRHESALRHSLRLYEIDEALKDDKGLFKALKNGEDGYAYVRKASMTDQNGKTRPGVTPIQFTGNTQEIDRQASREEGDWVKVMAMPPAILQGVGTAETASQERMGLAAGERESGALVAYFEDRMADVLAGIRGLMRDCYDDEDFQRLLGAEGAAVIKAWQAGSSDEGDEISVTFGLRAYAQETVEKKQLMEAITLMKSEVEPLTQLPKYDVTPVIEELCRRLDIGPPRADQTPMRALQDMVLQLGQALQEVAGAATGPEGPDGSPQGDKPEGGPNPAEGDGPSEENIQAGAVRGTQPAQPMAGV